MSHHSFRLGSAFLARLDGPREYDHLGFFGNQFHFSNWHTTLPSLEGPVEKVLLQNVRLSESPLCSIIIELGK